MHLAEILYRASLSDSATSIGDGWFAFNALTSVTIPDSVTSIGSDAFKSNYLTAITISNKITSIGSEAFYQNSLTSVTIPDNVSSIGNQAFYLNNDLNNLYITQIAIDQIGESNLAAAFDGYYNIKQVISTPTSIATSQSNFNTGIEVGSTIPSFQQPTATTVTHTPNLLLLEQATQTTIFQH